jgi:uncharacterized protein YbjT (DUF2867 family)
VAAGDRTVLVAGASGLVGREILAGLLADDSVRAVHSLGRRSLALQHHKLTQHTVNFAALPELPHADEAYVALGTTLKLAKSHLAMRAVDHDAVVSFARAALAAGVGRIGMVSAAGANTNSGIFYSRLKGETEDTLRSMGVASLVIARPSLLAGKRRALGQPPSIGEQLALLVLQCLWPLVGANYRPVHPRQVAAGLLHHLPRARPGTQWLRSGELQGF